MSARKRLDWSVRAERNLDRIHEYIASDNPGAAADVVVTILAEVELLADYPMLGKPWKREGTRKLVVAKFPYVVIYRTTPRAVFVLAVIHQSKRIA